MTARPWAYVARRAGDTVIAIPVSSKAEAQAQLERLRELGLTARVLAGLPKRSPCRIEEAPR